MLQNQHPNRRIIGAKTKPNKKSRNFIMALSVMILILGLGAVGYDKLKTRKQSSTQINDKPSEIPAYWYQKYFGSSVCEKDICKPEADPDRDKLTNAQEYFYHTDPLNDHTIGDDLSDGELVAAGFDPSRKGRMTFDEVQSDDNILGESLLLDADIKGLVAEDLNIDNVELPLVTDDQLNVVADSDTAIKNYGEKMKTTVDKYFPSQRLDSIVETFQKGDGASLSDARQRAQSLAEDLKKIVVPQKLVLFHKYNIAMYQLISDVTDPRAQGSDAWYDKVRALMATEQRLNLEQSKLNQGL
jgi:hypothetical protein